MANDLKAQIDLLWKGNSAAKSAERDVDSLTKSTEQLGIESAITAQKEKDLATRTKAMAKAVESGEKSIEDATKELKKYSNELGIADKESKSVESSSMSLGQTWAATGVAIAAVGIATKEAYQFIGEGADLLAAETKFDNLSASINTTGDALLGKMSAATKGLVTDADLVAGATEIMNLGLAKTEAGTVRMASAVGALNLDLGVMALTLANDSTARLDSLGLSMEDVARTKKELINSGFIGDAFDEAVLIELEKKMVILGDATETTAGQMQILETEWSNLTSEMKSGAASIAGPVVSSLSANVSVQRAGTDAVKAGIITQKEFNEILNSGSGFIDYNSSVLKILNERIEENQAAMDEAANSAFVYHETARESGYIVEDVAAQVEYYTDNVTYAIEAQEAATNSTRAYMVEQVALATAQEEAALAAAMEAQSFAILSTTADATKEAISTMYSEEVASAWNASTQIAQANADIITSLKEVALATIEAKTTEAVAAGEITAAAGNAYLAGVGEGLGLLSEDEANAQIAVGNASLEMAGTLNESLDYVKEHGEAVARTVGEMSGETAANIATTWEELDTQAQDAAVEAGVLDKKLAAMAENPYIIDVEVRYTTTGTPPASSVGGAGSTDAAVGRAGGTGSGGLYEGGSYIVGETGPELVTLPQGANITNAQDFRQQSYTFNTSSSDTLMRQLSRQGRRKR